MRPYRYALGLLVALLPLAAAAQAPPYPVIFVHGFNSNEATWSETMDALDRAGWGAPVTYHLDLNASMTSTFVWDDIAWTSPRPYWEFVARPSARVDSAVALSGSLDLGEAAAAPESASTRLFAVNFNGYLDGSSGLLWIHKDRGVSKHSESNCSAAAKQGAGLALVIRDVLDQTGAERVILVGHSMGGLAIREYLQRRIIADVPRWWVEPDDTEGGHRVASVVTYGTPHQGSDFPIAGIACTDSEATRDFRYSYRSPDVPERGRYLWGGSEQFVAYFHNRDVDVNGREDDMVDGLNVGDPLSGVGEDNPTHPLPRNVHYTWITSNADFFVDFNRQMLTYEQGGVRRLAPRGARVEQVVSDVTHTRQPSDTYRIAAAVYAPFATPSEPEPVPAELALSVYPNPAPGGAVTVAYALSSPGGAAVTVRDALGRTVRAIALGSKTTGEHSAQFDVGDLPAGLYLVTLETDSAPPVTAPLTVSR